MKFIKPTIYLLTFIISFFGLANSASAVTEFKATVKPSGGDYSTLATAENGLDYTGAPCDLTSASYLTAGYDGATGDPTLITDAEAVTWDAGASTGNIIHVTTTSKSGADKFFINVTAGSLADDDVINDGDGNTITVNGAPDTAQISIEIDGDWTGVTDTTAVTIEGWTTDATHYIKIYTTTAARHDGKWNEGKYRLEVTSNIAHAIFINDVHYITIDGLQIRLTASDNYFSGIYVTYSSSQTSLVKISNNIVKGILSGSATNKGIFIDVWGNDVSYIWNNIVYDFINGSSQTGIKTWNGYNYVYNNTVYNCAIGFERYSNGLIIAKNNISYNNTDNYFGDFDASSTNNLSGPSQTDAPGSNPRNAATVTFVDADNDDFHLALSDLGARGYGLSQYADANLPVTTDIDGNYRRPNGEPTDIGADEDIDSLDGDDVRISEIKQSGARYSTLFAWEADRDGVITSYYPEVAQIDGSWTNPDTTAVTITDWTTDATHYIKVYTTAAARHDGKWNTGKYRLEPVNINNSGAMGIAEEYVWVNGLQISVEPLQNASYSHAILINVAGDTTVANTRVSNCIIRKIGTDNAENMGGIWKYGQNWVLIAWNNIIYNFIGGWSNCFCIRSYIGTSYIYNNSLFSSKIGILVDFGTVVAKNNISYNNTDNYSGTFDDTSTNNLSGPVQNDAPGSNPRNAATVTFVDAGNDDFHLASNDAGARNYGINLAADSYLPFSTDIDGQQRVDGTPPAGGWDIGADEAVEAVIRFMRNINFGRNINIKR